MLEFITAEQEACMSIRWKSNVACMRMCCDINSKHFLPIHVVKAYLTCLLGLWLQAPSSLCQQGQGVSHKLVLPLLQDRIGIDVELLDEMQKSILGLYRSPPSLSPSAAGQRDLDAIQESINGLCSASIQTALYKAAGQLLDDLHRNVRLLGTPERSVCISGVSVKLSHCCPLLCHVLSSVSATWLY